ncbi:MAG: gamma-glutamyltranspeptidase / glutathione hydrolase [Gaiellaceae bacterium]|nr:gamma-glutamyltranspeptidase / glutathione hydrolase [Gaiellaceae bacterium]
MLAEGGNAVDAAVAAAFASWIAESPLTGPGAGGFMLIHRASDRSTRLLDFFVTVPGGGADPAAMETIDVDFSGNTRTPYLIGPASVAVPGVPAGLARAWKRFGSKPWAELIEPAIALAHDGVEVTGAQDYLHRLLNSILCFQPAGQALYSLGVGDRFRIPDLGNTLRTIADDGVESFYTGELARAITDTAPHISPEDLAGYRVIRRRPITTPFQGYEFMSNPPPSSGGVLIAYGLRLLANRGSFDAPAVVDAMREQATARRDGSFLRSLYRGGLATRLMGPVDAPSNTTHISVVDDQGNAVAMTCSTGAGSGVFVPGTGIHLNNMLGESDLAGMHKPGERLTSMMGPSIAFERGRPRLVVGSAGSARLRGAIMQIVVNVLARQLTVKDAVERPRIHWEDGVVHAEGGADLRGLENEEIVQWPKLNLFFGGANAVEIRPGGELAAAGDPRRGGDGVVVP